MVGKWVETSADRATHRYSGRGELSYYIVVKGDRLTVRDRSEATIPPAS